MIRDRVAECYTFCGDPVWKLQEKFGHKFGLQAGILALQDGSFVLYHYSAVVDTGVEVALVDSNGFSIHSSFHPSHTTTKLCSSSHQTLSLCRKEEWRRQCGGVEAPNGNSNLQSVTLETRGEKGLLLICEGSHGSWVEV